LTSIKIGLPCDPPKQFTTASGMPIWSPIVDRFMAANGFALRDRLIDVTPPNG